MVTVHYAEFDRSRARPDWRAGLIVALVHVLMFAWLLRSPLGEPIRATSPRWSWSNSGTGRWRKRCL
jgi:hypothetical protein